MPFYQIQAGPEQLELQLSGDAEAIERAQEFARSPRAARSEVRVYRLDEGRRKVVWVILPGGASKL